MQVKVAIITLAKILMWSFNKGDLLIQIQVV